MRLDQPGQVLKMQPIASFARLEHIVLPSAYLLPAFIREDTKPCTQSIHSNTANRNDQREPGSMRNTKRCPQGRGHRRPPRHLPRRPRHPSLLSPPRRPRASSISSSPGLASPWSSLGSKPSSACAASASTTHAQAMFILQPDPRGRGSNQPGSSAISLQCMRQLHRRKRLSSAITAEPPSPAPLSAPTRTLTPDQPGLPFRSRKSRHFDRSERSGGIRFSTSSKHAVPVSRKSPPRQGGLSSISRVQKEPLEITC